jgi:hypothetical protein
LSFCDHLIVLTQHKDWGAYAIGSKYQKRDGVIEKAADPISDKNEIQKYLLTIIAGLFLIALFFGLVIMHLYEKKETTNLMLKELNASIVEKNEHIWTQAQKLASAYEELRRINEDLESELSMRMDKIKYENRKLMEYAYFNTHDMRGTLASIFGIIMVIEMEEMSADMRKMVDMLKICSADLERVLLKVTNDYNLKNL